MGLSADTELLETLGEGSFAVVYLARLREGDLERTVVLKVLKGRWAQHPEILSRARDEARLLSRLNHDGVVRVEQLTEVAGRPAVVMEFIRGLSLDRVLDVHGALPADVALQVCIRVASALDAAYNKVPPGQAEPLRVVHRDLKPSNVILSCAGAVKILDFGTARGADTVREAETRVLAPGSPAYMAPERFEDPDAGPEVDVYGLGCILYELLSGVRMGRLPRSPRRHPEAVARRLAALHPPGLDDAVILGEIRSLVGDALGHDPVARPTAAEFARRARAILDRLPGPRMGLDRFAETVVEPLYEQRQRHPPLPLDGTLDPSGMGSSSASAWSATSAASAASVGGTGTATRVSRAARMRLLYVLVGVAAGLLVILAAARALLGPGASRGDPAREPAAGSSVSRPAAATVAPSPAGEASPPAAATVAPSPAAEAPAEEEVVRPASGQAPAGPRSAPARPGAASPGGGDPVKPGARPARGTPSARGGDGSAATPAPRAETAATRREAAAATRREAAATTRREAAAATRREAPAGERPVVPASAPSREAVERVAVRVASAPAGALVRVAGEQAETPGGLLAPRGRVAMDVIFPDGSAGTCTVVVEEGATLRFRVDGAGGVRCP